MIKGVQKKLIEVKLRGSRLYESACFVCKSGSAAAGVSESDLVGEADRIIREVGAKEKKRASVGGARIALAALLFFCIGSAIGFFVGVLVI